MDTRATLSYETRMGLREELLCANDTYILSLPKVELHVHIEGTLTPELRWKLAQRNNMTLRLERTGTEYKSIDQLKESYRIEAKPGQKFDDAEERFTFFEAYYSGFEFLITKEDFFDLAMNYFERAAAMNVRYCEPFFDPQGHTSRGVTWETMMNGFREAQLMAEKDLNIKSMWVMCFLRDLSPESAMEHYKAALPYRDMIVGIGLDSNEYDRPPSLFEEVFALARQDGFRLTAHCDPGQKDTHEHIRQVASTVAGSGAQRIDHGINAAESQALIQLILKNNVGMTLCPWAYLIHDSIDETFPRIRKLYDAGIQIAIASDDPTYMGDCWILHNMLLVKRMCNFTNADMAKLARSAVAISWAPQAYKEKILAEINIVSAK